MQFLMPFLMGVGVTGLVVMGVGVVVRNNEVRAVAAGILFVNIFATVVSIGIDYFFRDN